MGIPIAPIPMHPIHCVMFKGDVFTHSPPTCTRKICSPTDTRLTYRNMWLFSTPSNIFHSSNSLREVYSFHNWQKMKALKMIVPWV